MGLQGFNLLKQQPAPPTTWEKIYIWILGTARVIIIIVELIVIGAFVTRVVVDTQGRRIEKDIENRERTISGFEESIVRYRIIQTRTKNYKSIWENSSNKAPVMAELNSLLAADFADLRVSIEGDLLTIRGGGTIERISVLEKAVKESDSFMNVEAFEITTEEDDIISRGSFGLRAIIKAVNKRTETQQTEIPQIDPNIGLPADNNGN